jgi:hypothetical protein
MTSAETGALRDDAVELRKASFKQIANELDRRNISYRTCLIGERFGDDLFKRKGLDGRDLDRLFDDDSPTECLDRAVIALKKGIRQVNRISLENMALTNNWDIPDFSRKDGVD